jgi:hypothetical protein
MSSPERHSVISLISVQLSLALIVNFRMSLVSMDVQSWPPSMFRHPSKLSTASRIVSRWRMSDSPLRVPFE